MEDVKAVVPRGSDDGGGKRGVVEQLTESAGEILTQVESLLGMGPDIIGRDERSSGFVHEIRQKLEALPLAGATQTNIVPWLKIKLLVPQFQGDKDKAIKIQSLAETMERGLQTHYGVRVVAVASDLGASNAQSCDEWSVPTTSSSQRQINEQRRELIHPQIILLTGCTRTTIPEPRVASIAVNQSDGTIVVRTIHNIDDGDDQWKQLQHLLEKDVAGVLSGIIPFLRPSTRFQLSRVSVHLIVEDPTSHHVEKGDKADKLHFNALSKALTTSVNSVINPMLQELAFVYGGNVQLSNSTLSSKGSVGLTTHSSAYLPLPDETIELELSNDESPPTKYVTNEALASWMHDHSKQRNHNHVDSMPDSFEWMLYIPSSDHSPLRIHDESSGGEGPSITLERPATGGAGAGNTNPTGISIINLDSSMVDVEMLPRQYHITFIQSLQHLVGYIRAVHGLLPTHADHSTSTVIVETGVSQQFTFWELESIARSHWSSVLEEVLSKTDATMALMRKHANTLAFPDHVAYKLNNATHLLRQSISLVEQGLPTLHATSTLYGSLRYIESLQADPDFMELQHFAIDHYLAVFSPLVLPLMMPMLVGLVREVKRYNELKAKVSV